MSVRTAPAHFWEDSPKDILAGRDLAQGGTWLGVTKTGRLAGVTNYRNPNQPKESFRAALWSVISYAEIKRFRNIYRQFKKMLKTIPDLICWSEILVRGKTNWLIFQTEVMV